MISYDIDFVPNMCVYMSRSLYYESQPQAWAEYRYKAKLI